jgi:hypothetical protein
MSWKIKFEIEISGIKDMELANNMSKDFSTSLHKSINIFLKNLDISKEHVIIKNSKEIER